MLPKNRIICELSYFLITIYYLLSGHHFAEAFPMHPTTWRTQGWYGGYCTGLGKANERFMVGNPDLPVCFRGTSSVHWRGSLADFWQSVISLRQEGDNLINHLNTFTVSVHVSCSLSQGSTRIQSDVARASLAIATRCLADTKPFFPYLSLTGDIIPSITWYLPVGKKKTKKEN